MADDTPFSVFIDEINIENLVICTVKAETPTGLVLHGADKVQPRIEKRKFHTRKSDGNDSIHNSYETSDSNLVADEILEKPVFCLLYRIIVL